MATPPINFSNFKDPDKISVNPFRRVHHSLTNKLTTSVKNPLQNFVKKPMGNLRNTGFDPTQKRSATNKKYSFTKKGLKKTGSAALETGTNLVDVGSQLVGAVSTVGTIMTVTATTAATGAFAVAMSGPQAGITLGIVGLVLLAKSTYSNRDKAHRKLAPYVHSFLADPGTKNTDMALDANNLEHAGAAALSLVMDSGSQQQLAESKMTMAQSKWDLWVGKYNTMATEIDRLLVPNRTLSQAMIAKNNKKIIDLYNERGAFLQKAQGKGGDITEYARRLVHYGNYMQAFQVCGMAINGEVRSQNLVVTPKMNDVRVSLRRLQTKINADSTKYAAAVNIIQS